MLAVVVKALFKAPKILLFSTTAKCKYCDIPILKEDLDHNQIVIKRIHCSFRTWTTGSIITSLFWTVTSPPSPKIRIRVCFLFYSSAGIWYRMSRSVCFLYKGELTNGNMFRQEDMKSWVKIVAVEIDRNERERGDRRRTGGMSFYLLPFSNQLEKIFLTGLLLIDSSF